MPWGHAGPGARFLRSENILAPGAKVKNLKVHIKIFFFHKKKFKKYDFFTFFFWPRRPFPYKKNFDQYFERKNWPRGHFLKKARGQALLAPHCSRPCERQQQQPIRMWRSRWTLREQRAPHGNVVCRCTLMCHHEMR